MESDWLAGRHIDTVSLAWHAIITFSSKNALNLQTVNFFIGSELIGHFARDELVILETVFLDCFGRIATIDAVCKANAGDVGFTLVDAETWILGFGFDRKDILRHIDKTTSEITGVGST